MMRRTETPMMRRTETPMMRRTEACHHWDQCPKCHHWAVWLVPVRRTQAEDDARYLRCTGGLMWWVLLTCSQ